MSNDGNRRPPEQNRSGGNRITSEDVRISMSKHSAKRSGNKKILTALQIVILTCVLAFAIIDILFFNVKTIIVTGNERYDSQDIIQSSGIEQGTNFALISSKTVNNKVKYIFPGISEIKVIRKLPSTVELQVTESKPIMYITVGDNYYTLDENLVVLQKIESFEQIELMSLARVYVPDISRCIAGEYLVTEDSMIPEMLITLYKELENFNLLADVVEIDFTDKFDIEFTLGVKYTVKLGNIIDCDIKLEFLCGILEELNDDDVGTIDLSSGNNREAIFSRQ